MEGTFDLLNPIELLQLLSQAGQSGVFAVPGGEIYLERGHPVHARYKDKTGSDGLFEILGLQDGKFRFLAGERAKQSSLEGTLDNYLLQAIRFLDTRLDLSPFDQVEIIDHERAGRLTLSPDEFALMQLLNQPITLIELSSASGMALDTITLSISHLARLGVVHISNKTPHTVRLRVTRLEGVEGNRAIVDAQLLRVWRNQFGPFANLEVKVGSRNLQIGIEAGSKLGATLLMSQDALFFYNLNVEQEVMVWPAI